MRLFWIFTAVLIVCSVVVIALREPATTAGPSRSSVRPPVNDPISRNVPVEPQRGSSDAVSPEDDASAQVPDDANPAAEHDPAIHADDATLAQRTDWTGVTPRDLIRPPKRGRRSRNARTVEVTPPTGTGAADDPFIVTWDFLQQARLTFDPRRGLNEIPPAVSELDGRFVAIEGFVLAPWASEDITEMLLMRYEWDGCCIGTPPDAYTAIESTMDRPVRRDDLLDADVATLYGRLIVDPFVDGDWLLSLYRIDDARIR